MSAVVAKLKAKAEEADRQAARLRKIVELADELGEEGLMELVALVAPEAVSDEPEDDARQKVEPADPDAPRGRDAVRAIVRERPGIWTLTELRAEMEARGWFTTYKGMEAAVKRLCKINGEGRGLGNGRYVFPADYEKEVAIESDASDGAMIPPMFALAS